MNGYEAWQISKAIYVGKSMTVLHLEHLVLIHYAWNTQCTYKFCQKLMFPFSKFLSLKSTTTMYMTVCFLHSQLTKKVNKNIQQRTLSSFILTISLLPNNNYRYVKKPLIYGIQFSTAFQIMPPPRPKWKLLLTKERKGANKHNNNQPAFSFLSNVFFHHSPDWFLKRSIYWDTQEISKE